MATYGAKYTAEWRNTRNQVYRLIIRQRDYSGSVKGIATFAGCSLEVQGSQGRIIDPIVKTQLRFSMVDAWDTPDTTTAKYGNWQEFYTPDATLYRVELYEVEGLEMTIIWTGYITPDSWQEDLDYRGIITITARDNIGHLKDFPFVADGSITPDANGLIEIRWLLERAMEVIDFPMDFAYDQEGRGQYSPEVPESDNGDYLTEACVVASLFDGMDWYQVLEQTLEAIGFAFRYVGKNKCVATSLRNLPKMGHYTDATGSQTLEFYGGTQELDPAVKKIEEELDYKFTEEVPLDALGNFQFTAGSAYGCIVEGNGSETPIALHSAPLDILTNADGSVWDTGSDMFNPNSRTPADSLVNSEGADGWKQYAMIPGNRNTDSPSTSFRFHTKTAALRVTINFAPFPVGLIDSGFDQGKVTALQYSLSKILYQVSFVSEDGNTARYWTGSGWASDHAHTITREYDSENEYGTALEINLKECNDISAGKIVVTFSNIIYKRWDDSGIGVYARVQSILTGVISTRGAKSNKVTTINNEAYNVSLTRRPLFGALSLEMGFVRPPNYTAGLFYYPFVGANPALFPYQVRFTDGVATVPLPVLIHEQILCYYFGAARVLSGSCAPIQKARFSFDKLCVYKGVSYLLQGGTLDLFSGIIVGAVLREYAAFEDLWTGAPTYDDATYYNTDAPGTGHSGGNSGGSPGGGGGGYVLPIASASSLGGVKVGSGLSINAQTGVLSATGGGGSSFNGGEITEDLWLHTNGANQGSTLIFGDKGSQGQLYAYIQEDEDDHLTIYGRAGVTILAGDGGRVVIQGLAIALGELSNVELSSPSPGQALVFRDEKWKNETIQGGGSYVLPIASAGTLGGVKIGSGLSIDSETGVLSATGGGGSYTLPIASAGTLGGVKIGSGLSIDAQTGVLSVSGGGGGYVLPAASGEALGGIRIGFQGEGKNYPVVLDANNRAYVYVPWQSGSGGSTVQWGTPGEDYVPLSVDGTTKNLLTEHQPLTDYVTKGTLQTITGEKTFASNPVHIASDSGIDVDGSSYIDIGDARLKWDADTHSLYVTKRPGSSYAGDINICTDGDVSAGGAAGGAGNVKYVNLANQTAYNNLSTKDPATIYTIGSPVTKVYLGTIQLYPAV